MKISVWLVVSLSTLALAAAAISFANASSEDYRAAPVFTRYALALLLVAAAAIIALGQLKKDAQIYLVPIAAGSAVLGLILGTARSD